MARSSRKLASRWIETVVGAPCRRALASLSPAMVLRCNASLTSKIVPAKRADRSSKMTSYSMLLKKFARIKGELMKQSGRWMPVILAAVMVAVLIPNASFAQQKKLVLWTHWEQNPDFNK